MENSEIQKLVIITIVGSAVVLFFVGAFIVFFIAHQKKILKKQLQIEKQSSDHHIQMIANINETQEKERARIANSVHDDVVHLLFAAKMQVGQFKKSEYPDVKEMATETEALINLGMNEIRKTINSLTPTLLEKLGLVESIKELIRIMKGISEIKFNFILIGEYIKLKSSSELATYRVVQELLTNSVKHSNANCIDIIFNQLKDELIITVKDDGIGFDISQKTKSLGLGLKNIENRIYLINGKVKYESQLGIGTNCILEIPVLSNRL